MLSLEDGPQQRVRADGVNVILPVLSLPLCGIKASTLIILHEFYLVLIS